MKAVAVLLLAGAVAACAAPPPAPPKTEVEGAAMARPTIVSLNPCADAILAEIAPAQLLAISHYSHDPAATSMPLAMARAFRATGGTVEEIVALDPDMVVASSFLPPTTRSALEGLGIRVETIGIASTITDSETQVRDLARIAGAPARGAALVARIEAAVAAAAPPPGAPPMAAVVYQAGGIVPGNGSLIGDLLARTGFANHSAARGLGQGAYLSLEAMLADPPAVILAAGSDAHGEDRLLRHPALRALDHTARLRFDPALLYCGGPTIVRAAARLAQVRRAITQPGPAT